MKRFSGVIICISLVFTLSLPGSALADPIVSVGDTCTVVDTAGDSHAYNSGQFLGICALAAAKEQGAVSSYTLQNFSFGLFLQSLGGTTPGATQFWNLYKNGVEATVGLTDMTIATGDILKFQLTDFTDNSQIGSPIIFQIGTLTATPAPTNTPQIRGGGLTLHSPFDVPLALAFLEKAQNADGSFDSLLLSDWIAMAFAGDGAGDAQKKLAAYFTSNPPTLSGVTDYERHAMALEALGINPYSGTSIDYITPIVSAFDGSQIGNVSLVNDDIFAIFPLMHAGYGTEDDIISKTLAFIISKQLANGSWDNSADMTAAAIQALSLARQHPDIIFAITSAANYLHAQQQTNGGFGPVGQANSYSTSWVLQAIVSLADSHLDWASGYFTPQYFLSTLQQQDGGVELASADANTRVWATAYAIPAIQGRPWHSLLSSFEKPEIIASDIQETATMATSSVITPELIESLDAPERLPGVAAQKQKQEVAAEQVPEVPVSEPTTSTEATTTIARSSLPVVQTAAAATVDYRIRDLWKWLLAFLSSLF